MGSSQSTSSKSNNNVPLDVYKRGRLVETPTDISQFTSDDKLSINENPRFFFIAGYNPKTGKTNLGLTKSDLRLICDLNVINDGRRNTQYYNIGRFIVINHSESDVCKILFEHGIIYLNKKICNGTHDNIAVIGFLLFNDFIVFDPINYENPFLPCGENLTLFPTSVMKRGERKEIKEYVEKK